jgi:hypothetical protein
MGDRQIIRFRISWDMDWSEMVGLFDGLVVVHSSHKPHIKQTEYFVLGHQFDCVLEGDAIPEYAAVCVTTSEDKTNRFIFKPINET